MQKFNLYRNPDTANQYKGEPVKRMQNFDKQRLFESGVSEDDYDIIMRLMIYLETTYGVNGVSFTTPTRRNYYLEKVVDSSSI